EALSETLELAGFRVIAVGSAEEALAIVEQRQLDMLITDVNMGDMDGHELQQRVRLLAPMVPVLVMTAYGSIRRSVEAMRSGAVDYLVKPFDQQTLVETVRRYIAVPGCSNDDEPVAEEVSSQNLLALARKVAASDATVLI